MFTLQAVIDETRVTLTAPPLLVFYALAALCLVGAALALRKASALAVALAVPLSVLAAAVVFGVTFGWINLLFVPSRQLFAWHFRPVFIAVATLSAMATIALVCSLGSLLAALRRSELVSRVPAALVLVVSTACAVFSVTMVRRIGSPNALVPRLGVDGITRGQRGLAHTTSARLEYPGTRNWLFTSPARALSEAQLVAEHASCVECSRAVNDDVPGVVQVNFRAVLRGYSFERSVPFTVEDDRGDPRLPLQVGARWAFRDRLDSSTRAGGWAAAMSDGLRSLAPRDVVLRRLGDQRAELRVERTFVADGVRLWSLVFEHGQRRETFTLFTMDGQTRLTRDLEHPRAAQQPWFREDAREARLPAGLLRCASSFVPFSACGDGSDPRIPLGPAWGHIGDHSGTGLFVTAITLGAVVPGAGPRTSWCLDQFTEGSGVRASAVTHAAPPSSDSDHREAESIALCGAPAFQREPDVSTRTTRARPPRVMPGRPPRDRGIIDPRND